MFYYCWGRWIHCKKIGNKHLIFASAVKIIEVSAKYTEIWDGIKNLIEEINHKPCEYGKIFMKFKFSSDDSLPLNKILKLIPFYI